MRTIYMTASYHGNFISGIGNSERLSLLDKSFAMLNASPTLPCLKMLYKSGTDMFSEGFIWGGAWWIQNSYGFTLGAVPLLDPFWFRVLQNSYDGFWNRIGDGSRCGRDDGIPRVGDLYSLVAPDGALGDCICEGKGIAYRQGDDDWQQHDWFYEATAAGVNMQCDLLLFDRRSEQIDHYVPLLWRSLNLIESTRAANGLFLVGTAANLLAPSYGGSFDEKTGKIGKGYLAGLAITYSAALIKFIEVLKLQGDTNGCQECRTRLEHTLKALPQLMTPEGYFAKSMDPDGTLHGVYGQAKYGYLDSVCNIDAIAGHVVDDATARSIYNMIASIPQIRPAGVLCNNYPHLDDTLQNYKKRNADPHSLGFRSGDWVDGGCWATVEGRALLSYLHLNQYDDAFRAAAVYMKWAEEYRQDAPLSQWGHNTNNPWQKENDDYSQCDRPVSVMIDNFAAVTCLIRGLFEYTADAEGLTLTPHIPCDIQEYSQHEPIWFNGCKIYLAFRNGNAAPIVKVNGQVIPVSSGVIKLPAELLPRDCEAFITIDASGADSPLPISKNPAPIPTGKADGLPEDVAAIYAECMNALQTEQDPFKARAYTEAALFAEVNALRRKQPFDKRELRPMTENKIQEILNIYDETVREIYNMVKKEKRSYASVLDTEVDV